MLQAVLAFATMVAPFDSTATTRDSMPPRSGVIAALVAVTSRLPSSALTDSSEPRAFTYSDGYEIRLTIHKTASHVTLPLFALQFAAGTQLFNKSTDAPAWAKRVHGPAATGTAPLFAVNTVTGVWNL